MKRRYISLIAALSLLIAAALGSCSEPTKRVQETIQPDLVDSVSVQDKAKLWEKQKQQREDLEAQRKVTLGDFYVPLPPLEQDVQRSPQKTTVEAKALYLTAHVAGFPFQEEDISYYVDYILSKSSKSGKPFDESKLSQVNKLEKALAICKATEVNALVIDIKNDDGLVAWNSEIPIVNQLGTNSSAPLKEYQRLLDYLKTHDIYSIARIVAFKDPAFARLNSAHAIQLNAGGVYTDYSGMAWVNPFDDYVWKYLVAISQEAALRGFQEIQYDYVRFPDSAKRYNPITNFPGREGRDKDEGIEQFLQYASKELEPYRVHLSADVFGTITRSWDDKPEDIGQTWRKIANNVDYICPMIYPSHYGSGQYKFTVPDQHPYEVMRLALMEAIERNAAQKEPGLIRPWIQGFDATWVKGHIKYTPPVIADQIIAAAELGIQEYIIWNAANNYDPMIFFYQDRVHTSNGVADTDRLGRTKEQALKLYQDAEKNGSISNQYLLTPISHRLEDYDAFEEELKRNSEEHATSATPGVDPEITYQIIKENDIFKVWKTSPVAK